MEECCDARIATMNSILRQNGPKFNAISTRTSCACPCRTSCRRRAKSSDRGRAAAAGRIGAPTAARPLPITPTAGAILKTPRLRVSAHGLGEGDCYFQNVKSSFFDDNFPPREKFFLKAGCDEKSKRKRKDGNQCFDWWKTGCAAERIFQETSEGAKHLAARCPGALAAKLSGTASKANGREGCRPETAPRCEEQH